LHRRRLAVAAIIAALAAPAPSALAAVHVHLRVEGPHSTLFQGTVVPARGALRDSAGIVHRTRRPTPLGALVSAARRRGWPLRLRWFDVGGGGWSGFFVAGIDRIVPRGTRHTWAFEVGHAAAGQGAGAVRARDGMHVLFAYSRLSPSFHTEPTLGLRASARQVVRGGRVTFTVTAYDDAGHGSPAAGAWVWVDGVGVQTGKLGTASVRLRRAGSHRVKATRFRAIRSRTLWIRAGS
jgi:hypothetical protein